VVDDNAFILEAWKAVLEPDAGVHLFHSPEELKARLEVEPGFLRRLAFLVTDYCFDDSPGDGLDVGRMVKARLPQLPVLLSSESDLAVGATAGSIDRTIAKMPVPFAELSRTVALHPHA
jgi:DNA-binding NtrC family response regulator